MVETKDSFSSKPKQIAKAVVKISQQIFGKIDNVKVNIVGDEEMVEDIGENLKKFSFKSLSILKKPINDFFDKKSKKIIDEVKFLQDYKKSDIFIVGFKKGETAFEEDIPMMLNFGEGLVCGTGDNFVQDINKELDVIDVFDMEAYALAKVCWMYELHFTSYKYITDNANEKSAKDWESNLADGVKEFKSKILNNGPL